MTTASENTIARLTGALSRHDVGDLLPVVMAQLENGLTQSGASALIQLVESLPMTDEAKAAKDNKVTEVGFYSHPADGRVVKVQRSKKGYLYAMEQDGGKWKFTAAADRPSGRSLLSELDASRVADRPVTAVNNDTAALENLLQELRKRTA